MAHAVDVELIARNSSLYREESYSKGLQFLEKHVRGTPLITWVWHILNLDVPRGSRMELGWEEIGKASQSLKASLPQVKFRPPANSPTPGVLQVGD